MISRSISRSMIATAAVLLASPRHGWAQEALPPPDPPEPASSVQQANEPAPDPAALHALLEPRPFEATVPAPVPPEQPAQVAMPADSTLALGPPAPQPAPAPVVATVAGATAAVPAAMTAAAGAPGGGAGPERKPLAYAQAKLIEVGGAMALTHDSETTAFRLMPSIGYFIVEKFEISLLPELRLLHVDDAAGGAHDVSIGAAVETSYHVRMTDLAFVSGGVGLGVRYAKDPQFSTFLRTRLGLDVLLGGTGIFKPAVFLDMGFSDGVTAGGLEAGFTLML